jgi:hypothetical protein
MSVYNRFTDEYPSLSYEEQYRSNGTKEPTIKAFPAPTFKIQYETRIIIPRKDRRAEL